jgi:outer membrane lipoprotein carrier protein
MLRIHVLLLTVCAPLALAACAGESGGAAVSQGDPARPVAQPAGGGQALENVHTPEPAPHAEQGGEAVAALPGTPGAPAVGAGPPAAPGAAAGVTPAPAGPVQPAPAQQPAQAPETASDADAILRRAESAYENIRTMEATFVQDLSVPLLNSTQRSRGQLFVRKPDRILMRFTDPSGDVVVADGTHLWMYYPSTDARQVVRTSVSQGGQGLDLQSEFLSNPTARYRAVLNGTESVGGRTAHVLTLTPRAASPYQRVRIWVDAQDHLVRRFEITETNESVRRLELSNLRPNTQVSEQLFRFTPPAGTQVFDQ